MSKRKTVSFTKNKIGKMHGNFAVIQCPVCGKKGIQLSPNMYAHKAIFAFGIPHANGYCKV